MTELQTVSAESGPLLDEVRAMFRDYAGSLPIDLAFQGFEAELEALPGKYAGPAGAIFLALAPGGDALGCVAVRPYPRPGTCELKRLYVRPPGRGTGVGGALLDRAIGFAAGAGYGQMLLDTLPSMTGAIRLYEARGFGAVPPFGSAEGPPLLYFGKSLS